MSIISTGKFHKPFNEVDRDEPGLRMLWWAPVEIKRLPELKYLAIAGVVILILFVAQALVGLLAAAGAGYYIYSIRKSNLEPVDVTRLSIIAETQKASQVRAQNQAQVDLMLEDAEFSEAMLNHLGLSLGWGEYPISNVVAGDQKIYQKIHYSTAVITSQGIGYHSATYDAINNVFQAGESEMMLWNRVARVIRSGNVLTIEATSGSKREFQLDNSFLVQTGNAANLDQVITTYVNPFVKAAQEHLKNN